MILEVKDFSKIYDKRPVIKDISVVIDQPMIIGLIGDNGAGKTTFLKCIAGFIRNYKGIIQTDKTMTASIESPAFFDNLSVAQNLQFAEKLMIEKSEFSINDTLKYVGLEKDANKKFRDLSLGMKQKLVIARMILNDRDIYLLDEPFNSLDVKTKKELQTLLQKLKERGKTIIISSHILEELAQLSDAVWYLKDGELVNNIDLHSSERKYNIVIKTVSEQLLEKITQQNTTVLEKTNHTISLRAHILSENISTYLQTLVKEEVEVIEYYDVTNKLGDYMMNNQDKGGSNL